MRTRLVRRRLEHALLPRLRLEGLRLGAAEFQPVEEAPAAIEPGRGGCGIVCALGFFRPRRCAANLLLLLEGDAANISGPRVEQRALLARGAISSSASSYAYSSSIAAVEAYRS